MLVFIDESGDSGFKVDLGSTPVFVVAMVIFREAEEAQRTEALIRDLRERERVALEFKFSKSSNDIRDKFFNAVARCEFRVRALVVRKSVIRSGRLRTDKESFYRYFVGQLVRHDNDRLADAKVVIDGSGEQTFRRDLATQLRRTGEGAVRDVRLKDSKGDPLVQLADMCVGAIARSYREERPDARRWRQKLAPKIDDVWEFR